MIIVSVWLIDQQTEQMDRWADWSENTKQNINIFPIDLVK